MSHQGCAISPVHKYTLMVSCINICNGEMFAIFGYSKSKQKGNTSGLLTPLPSIMYILPLPFFHKTSILLQHVQTAALI